MKQTYKVYGYDYNIDQKSNQVYLHGYISNASLANSDEQEGYSKISIQLQNVQRTVDVQYDSSLFETPQQMRGFIDRIQIKQRVNRKTGDSYGPSSVKDLHRGDKMQLMELKKFKGISNKSGCSHLRFYFNSFVLYEQFKQTLCWFNKQFEQYIENRKVGEGDINLELLQKLYTENFQNSKLEKHPFRMSEDDSVSCFIYKLQRYYKFSLSGWNDAELEGIRQSNSQRYEAWCDVRNIKMCPDYQESSPLTILTWDIEVSMEGGKFDSDGLNANNITICIGGSFGRVQERNSNSIYNFCITFVDFDESTQIQNHEEKVDIIRASSEKDMIMKFGQLINDLDPSFLTGFNDSSFDWPFITKKLELFGILQTFAETVQFGFKCSSDFKGLFRQQDIKISASDTREGTGILIPGIIYVDTRTLMMKSQKLERKSLNEYLKANDLPLKIEVSFEEMNMSFRRLISEQAKQQEDKRVMYKILKYCTYDADACRLLWQKRNILQEQIEVSNLSFTPLRCAFNNAGGIKVRNMVASFAFDEGFSVPMASTSCDVRLRDVRLLKQFEKYPGAYVQEPVKGVTITPVGALDFASLYPSIIMAKNLSPEKILDPEESVESGESQKYNKIQIDFAKDQQQCTLTGYVISRPNGVGIYPRILKYLFDQRKIIKGQIEDLKEQSGNSQEIQFKISLLDAKQSALKVFMNTFYGEAGNQNSPLFDVLIAGGTTSFGQQYIKQVYQFIKDRDCEIIAGDTDSVYFRPRLSHYQLECSCGEKHSGNHINNSDHQMRLSTFNMISQAFDISTDLRNQINKIVGDQTFGFLKMEFEELLFPSLFTGKKKYCGVMYKQDRQGSFGGVKYDINIKNKDIVLLKGIDFIKSQYPELIKQSGYQTIQDILNSLCRIFESPIININMTTEQLHRYGQRSFANTCNINCSTKQLPQCIDQRGSTFTSFGFPLPLQKQERETEGRSVIIDVIESPKELTIFQLFQDNIRPKINPILVNLVKQNAVNLKNTLQTITPSQYGLLSSRKKIRDTKSGEMKLFNDRLNMDEVVTKATKGPVDKCVVDLADIDFTQLQQAINIQELQELNIQPPQKGEILDIVFLKPNIGVQTAKASQKMHLLQYAQLKQLPIDYEEYLKMFRTTAARIIVCCYYDNIPSHLTSKQQDKIAMDNAKKTFDTFSDILPTTTHRISKEEVKANIYQINTTLQDIQMTCEEFNHLISQQIQKAKKLQKSYDNTSGVITEDGTAMIQLQSNIYKKHIKNTLNHMRIKTLVQVWLKEYEFINVLQRLSTNNQRITVEQISKLIQMDVKCTYLDQFKDIVISAVCILMLYKTPLTSTNVKKLITQHNTSISQ